ncbi:mitochondrial 37S ribosomal protein uS4m [Ascoidea rubescens DSM 1968]|uniref:Small ribosomal subunit protein uS4m n=1 Tax=Ascoidea rubescens DSM 1968 TaxID=1344418 RepID=A0A1D2VCT1_9ASCO|nr:alpha-L RNA-binding motif-containing protein [Ascoidea rubescens DSM 1968]ODV59445.1 alpha-L RNA-binding motif-containing protein [Ascoidea rubescens DSM 1968]
MTRKISALNSLSRGHIRTSWNKYNLFNLYKKRNVNLRGKSLYQQKWYSKAESRAYHGEHLTEKQWSRTFVPNLKGVAQLDSGLQAHNTETPLVLQTYAPLERRLDFALFRSFFASSVRQARRFILSSHVHVNGVKVIQPSYPLRPGDIFSCNPEKVLLALGAKKPSVKQAAKIDFVTVNKWNDFVKKAKENPEKTWNDQLLRKKHGWNGEIDRNTQRILIANSNKVVKKIIETEQEKCDPELILFDILRISSNAGNSDVAILKALTPKFGGNAKKCLTIYQDLLSTFENEIPPSLPNLSDQKLSKLVNRILGFNIQETDKTVKQETSTAKDLKDPKDPKDFKDSKDSKQSVEPKEQAASKGKELVDSKESVETNQNQENTKVDEEATSTFAELKRSEIFNSEEKKLQKKQEKEKTIKIKVKKLQSVKYTLNQITSSLRNQIDAEYNSKFINPNKDNFRVTDLVLDPEWHKNLKPHKPINIKEIVEDESNAKIFLPFQKGLYGRQEAEKPYFTPWKLRPFMGPFAIYPHHIEIDFDTCHAVYLSDPVARPGSSEVITPFGKDISERAFMFYQRKRL